MKIRKIIPDPDFDLKGTGHTEGKRTNPEGTKKNFLETGNALVKENFDRFPSTPPWPSRDPSMESWKSGEKPPKSAGELSPLDFAYHKRMKDVGIVEDKDRRVAERKSVVIQLHDEQITKMEDDAFFRLRQHLSNMVTRAEAQTTLLQAVRFQNIDQAKFLEALAIVRADKSLAKAEILFNKVRGISENGALLPHANKFSFGSKEQTQAVIELMAQKLDEQQRSLWELQNIMAGHAMAALSTIGYNQPGRYEIENIKADQNTDSRVSSLKGNSTKKVS